MNRYYIAQGGESIGPFTVEELRTHDLKADTKVWCAGMEDWLAAGLVPELSEQLSLAPPPPPETEEPAVEPAQRPPLPRTWLVESILVTLFCCLPLGIAGIIHAGKVESLYLAGRYREAEEASRKAGKWTGLGFWLALVFVAIYIVWASAGGLAFVANDL